MSDFDAAQTEADAAGISRLAGESFVYSGLTVSGLFSSTLDSMPMDAVAFSERKNLSLWWACSEPASPSINANLFRPSDSTTYTIESADRDEMGWMCRIVAPRRQ